MSSSGINDKLDSLLFLKDTILIQSFFFFFAQRYRYVDLNGLYIIYSGLKSNESILFRWFRESNNVEISSTPKVSLLSRFISQILLTFLFHVSILQFNLAIEIRLYKIEFDYLTLMSISLWNKYKISVKEIFQIVEKSPSIPNLKKIEITRCWKFRILTLSFLFNSRYSSSFNERSLTYIINLYSKFLHEEKNRKD